MSVCVVFGATYAVAATTHSPVEQELIYASNAVMDASNQRDVNTYARLTADSFIFTHDDGSVSTRAALIKSLKTLRPADNQSSDPRDFAVHLYGDTAIVSSRITVHEKYGNRDIISEERRTQTFVKMSGAWLEIASQESELPVNFRKPLPIGSARLVDFAGQYETRPGEMDIVSVKDGKLWSVSDGEREEYQSGGGDSFFVKDDLGTEAFVRDAQGHVTGYTYRQPDGQEYYYRKIK
jgi:hypothetical protein